LESLSAFDHVIPRIIASYFHQKLTQTADIGNIRKPTGWSMIFLAIVLLRFFYRRNVNQS